MRAQTTALCLAAFLASPSAKAALINEGDWSLDTDTLIEWLSPALTDGLSYADVLAGAGGWTTSGWHFATVNQFTLLAETYIGLPDVPFNTFIPPGGGEGVISNSASVRSVVTTLGLSYYSGYPGDPVTAGDTIEDIGYLLNGPKVNLGTLYAATNVGYWSYQPWQNLAEGQSGIGSFLVREAPPTPATPEPSSWVMMLLGFTGLGFAGHRRARAGSPSRP
jgi:PEP-CTERM motif